MRGFRANALTFSKHHISPHIHRVSSLHRRLKVLTLWFTCRSGRRRFGDCWHLRPHCSCRCRAGSCLPHRQDHSTIRFVLVSVWFWLQLWRPSRVTLARLFSQAGSAENGLAACGKNRGQTDMSTSRTAILLIAGLWLGTDSSVPAFYHGLLGYLHIRLGDPPSIDALDRVFGDN